MPFQKVTPDAWKTVVADLAAGMTDRAVADALMRFQLLPGGPYADQTTASVHRGNLTIDGDFFPPSQVVVIHGDLTVGGALRTGESDGDGQVTLVVFGNVRCRKVDHDWGSLLLVTGDLIAREWVFAAREDSALVIGGDFRTPIFVGADLWASVGGTVEMDWGYGYAVPLAWSADAYGAPRIEPRYGWRELAIKLGMGRNSIRDEESFLCSIETKLTAAGIGDSGLSKYD